MPRHTLFTDTLSKIFLVLVTSFTLIAMWFVLHSEYYEATTIVHDNTTTSAEYDNKRGSKALLFINRGCEVHWREYEDGLTIYIKFKKNENTP